MPNCAVPTCCNRSYVKSKRQEEAEEHRKITFHRFPKAEDRRLLWVNALGLDLTTVHKNTYICSLHFPEESFDRTSVACVRLRDHAVPCIHKAEVSELKVDSYVYQVTEPTTSATVQPQATENEEIAMQLVASPGETSSSYHDAPKRRRKLGEECESDLPKRRRVTKLVDELFVQPRPLTSDVSTQTYPDATSTAESTDDREAAISTNQAPETPRKTLLRKTLEHQKEKSRKLIQALKKQNRRQLKKIAELKSILNDLKAKNLIADEQYDILKIIGMSNTHFLKHYVAKTAKKLCKGKNKACGISRQYSPELRTFAVTLHYYSPRAYNYVRKHFDSCLPHPKTISEWYRSIDGEPGFIDEAFACIAERVKVADYQLVGTLVFDEMSIRQHIEYDGKRYSGYVDLGKNFANDTTTVAKEALMFMFVCMNGAWKIPIAYFITNGVSAEQKCNLILQSISSLHEVGVKVAALTFDGTRTNLSVVKKFGCNLNPDLLQTHFMHPVTKERIYIIMPDPSHMVKLVRNTFGDLKVFIDQNKKRIEWEFLKELNTLQTKEGLHPLCKKPFKIGG